MAYVPGDKDRPLIKTPKNPDAKLPATHLEVPAMKELTHKLVEHTAPQPKLNEAQKESASRIETAIKGGHLKALEREMHSFAGRADDLNKIMNKVGRDLNFHAHGLVADYETGTYRTVDMNGKEYDRREGTLKIFSEKGGQALEISTDGRNIGTGIAGPVEVKKSGKSISWVNHEVGQIGDPNKLFEKFSKRF